jgi:hypothetical protein
MMTAHETAWLFLKTGCVGKARNCDCSECVSKMCGPNCDCEKCATKKSVQLHYPSDDDNELCDIAAMGMCDCTPETGCKMKKIKRFRKSINSSFAKSKKDPRLARAGVSGYNKPKRTPGHGKKSHVVVARSGGKVKTIRFGQQGKSGAGANPKTPKEKARQKSFKARHRKNIARGPMSAAYWADKVKW